MVPVLIAAGAALFAGGVAVGRASNGGEKDFTEEAGCRTIPASEVPTHIRKKIEEKKRKKR